MFIAPADYEKRVSVIVDDLPGFDKKAAASLCEFIAANGYSVARLTVDELLSARNPAIGLGFLLIIPCAASLPLECAPALKSFNGQGGKLLILGGPLFNAVIRRKDGAWIKEALDEKELSAVTSAGGDIGEFRLEGICPSYKVFLARGVKSFDRTLCPDEPLDVVCPIARPYGSGFGNERENRFIPLLNLADRKGAAAFIMLSDDKGRCELTSGVRPGSICAETVGSIAASIGLLEQYLLSIRGAGELLLETLARLKKGIFLYEGGSEGFVFRPGEELKFGCRVLNSTHDFQYVPVRFTVKSASGRTSVREMEVPAAELNISSIGFKLKLDLAEEHEVVVEIPGVDRIEHKLLPDIGKSHAPEEFVKAENGSFTLAGKPWVPVGINYWPTHFPPYEMNAYFRGWFDKSAYDPRIVEEDLAEISSLGMNLILTRLEAGSLERSAPQLRHLLLLCERYGLKLGLATSNLTNPLYYNGREFRRLLKESGLAGNPALFCYDIVWEFGHRPLCGEYRRFWDADWRKWIEERYGSLERAETDWGFPANRKEDGSITCPTDPQIGVSGDPDPSRSEDGPWRRMVAAYRRFMDDFLSRRFNDATRDIRAADPNHLISFRQGRLTRHDVSYSAAICKKLDFLMPEGYHIEMGKDGADVLCFSELYMEFLSGGKPILWAEFGKSICGISFFNTNRWNHEACAPLREDADLATKYMDFFCDSLVKAHAAGFAPWFWPGGRRVHERGDNGLRGEDGVLRENGKAFLKHAKRLPNPRPAKEPEHWLTVDRDAHPAGNYHICFNSGKEAYAKHGDALGVRSEASGTTTADVPDIAVGNVPCDGSNPHKYLNAEFNFVKIDGVEIANGSRVALEGRRKVRLSVSVGNLHEVKWLPGDVELHFSNGLSVPLPHALGAYGDLLLDELEIDAKPGDLARFRMRTSKGLEFGEAFRVAFE